VDAPKPSEESKPRWEIVEQVLSYFLRNPKAIDTLEGVVRWRLLEEEVHRSFRQTELALHWLVAQGFVETLATRHSNEVFRLNATRREDAARLIAEAHEQNKMILGS
jgi:hypothetical protein